MKMIMTMLRHVTSKKLLKYNYYNISETALENKLFNILFIEHDQQFFLQEMIIQGIMS